jgi:hypothetical protein
MRALILFLLPTSLWAACISPVSRTNVGASTVLTSTKYNLDFNTIFNRVNNLPGDCIQNATVTGAKLAPGAVSNSKIADGAITNDKLASGAMPEAGRLLRVLALTSSGTWVKQGDMGSIMVQLVGGGGASFHASATAGGATSFGSHCIANGGSIPASSSSEGGAGGTATGGDINLPGGRGESLSTYNPSNFYVVGGGGGLSALGHFGQGGMASHSSTMTAGGGAGGYCAKIIQRESLAATETVTVGEGGTNAGAGTTAGNPGIVIIYEYSL